MPTALITGITGQDGSYLAELLLTKGYKVHGLVRRSSESQAAPHRSPPPRRQHADRIALHYGDLDDPLGLVRILSEVQPDEIYHLAAQSHVQVSFDVPDYTGRSPARHDAAARSNPGVRGRTLLSGLVVGDVRFCPPPQTELTPFHPRSPYAVAKVYAYWAP